MQLDNHDDLSDNQQSDSPIPKSLAKFDVEIVVLRPLRVYVFTACEEEWQEAIEAFRVLMLEGLLSPYSFIELDEKGKPLQGVYAKNLHRIIYGEIVKMIEEAAYHLANDIDAGGD